MDDGSVTHENPYQAQNSIVNRHDFHYLLNPALAVCDSNVYLLVYVHSSVENYQRRSIIRETWASRAIFPHLRLVFMLGKSSNQLLMQSVAYEFELYRDIVQEDFIDSYKNLTYKGLMALKWASTYCSKAKYILKADDDIIINTFTLIKHLKNLERYQTNLEQMILCLMWEAMPVVRDNTSKWFLNEEEYPLETFPRYCSGSAFLLTNGVPAKMYNASLYVPFFWVDDYYITGAVASAANISYMQIGSLYSIIEETAFSRFMSPKSFYLIMVGHFPTSMNFMRQVWDRILLVQRSRSRTSLLSDSFSWDQTVYIKH